MSLDIIGSEAGVEHAEDALVLIWIATSLGTHDVV